MGGMNRTTAHLLLQLDDRRGDLAVQRLAQSGQIQALQHATGCGSVRVHKKCTRQPTAGE
jgi:hypothetical protein